MSIRRRAVAPQGPEARSRPVPEARSPRRRRPEREGGPLALQDRIGNAAVLERIRSGAGSLPEADVRAGEEAGGIGWEPRPSPDPAASAVPVPAGSASLVLSPEGGAPGDLLQRVGPEFQAGLARCQAREAACREAHEEAGGIFGGGRFRTGPSVGGILCEDAEREMLVHARIGRSEDILGTTLAATLGTAVQAWEVRDEALGRLAASGLADIGDDGRVHVASGDLAARADRARRRLGPAAAGLEACRTALHPAPRVRAGIAAVQATRAALGSALDRARARAVDASADADREERARIAAFVGLCDDFEAVGALCVGAATAAEAVIPVAYALSDTGSPAGGAPGTGAESLTGATAEWALRSRLDALEARLGATTALSATIRAVAEEGDLAGRHAAFEAAVLDWSAGLAEARAGADRRVGDLAALGLLADLAADRPAGGAEGLGRVLADLGSAQEAAGFAAAVAPPLGAVADRLSAFHDEAAAQASIPAGAVALDPLRRGLAGEGDLAQVWAREARRLAAEAIGTRDALAVAGAWIPASGTEVDPAG